jgi:hypothetical protein
MRSYDTFVSSESAAKSECGNILGWTDGRSGVTADRVPRYIVEVLYNLAI